MFLPYRAARNDEASQHETDGSPCLFADAGFPKIALFGDSDWSTNFVLGRARPPEWWKLGRLAVAPAQGAGVAYFRTGRYFFAEAVRQYRQNAPRFQCRRCGQGRFQGNRSRFLNRNFHRFTSLARIPPEKGNSTFPECADSLP